jgi:hypothetical protein
MMILVRVREKRDGWRPANIPLLRNSSPVSCLLSPFSGFPVSVLPSPFSRLRLRSPVSVLPSPFSRLRSPVSRLRFPVSCLPSPVSCLLSPVSGLPSPVSGLRFPVSVFRSPFSGLRSPLSSSQARDQLQSPVVLQEFREPGRIYRFLGPGKDRSLILPPM